MDLNALLRFGCGDEVIEVGASTKFRLLQVGDRWSCFSLAILQKNEVCNTPI
jgi:hypothetical protein